MSILYRIHDDTHPFNEAVGVLQRVTGSGDDVTYGVCKKDGSVVEVPAADVLRLKIVPPHRRMPAG